jgi:hypothetical protein
MTKYSFLKISIYFFFVLMTVFYTTAAAHSQYIEFGTYQYRVDKPALKKFITYTYDNVLGVVDSNFVSDRYTKEVIIVNKNTYDILVRYIQNEKIIETGNIHPELYLYIKIFNDSSMVFFSKFSLDDYRSYLIRFFDHLEKSDPVPSEEKLRIIQKLKYWQ